MYGTISPMYGKHHTSETRQKISSSKKGAGNPMYRVKRPQSEEELQWRRETASLLPGPRLSLRAWKAMKQALASTQET
jgi:hypothetical protein